MSNIGFPQFNVKPIDGNGNWNRQWLLLIQELWNRSGGTVGQSTTELIVDLPEDAGIEEIKMDLSMLRNETNRAPPGAFFSTTEDPNARIEALEAALQALSREVDALKQGTTP